MRTFTGCAAAVDRQRQCLHRHSVGIMVGERVAHGAQRARAQDIPILQERDKWRTARLDRGVERCHVAFAGEHHLAVNAGLQRKTAARCVWPGHGLPGREA
ncbi:MAG: hypothetical protein IPL75_20820 [Acidobacteria bacterium]|nr:hypothetical protein [Acidobacteriota bacterium]